MPQVPPFRPSVGAPRDASQALAPSNLGQAPLQALQGLGATIQRDVGGLAARMQKAQDQAGIMSANADASGVLAETQDPEWLANNVGEGTRTVNGIVSPKIPTADFADWYKEEYSKRTGVIAAERLKDVSGDTRSRWEQGAAITLNRKMPTVFRQQFNMTKAAEARAFHAENLAMRSNLAEVASMGSGEEIVEAFNVHSKSVRTRGEQTDQPSGTVEKLVKDGRTTISKVLDQRIETSIENGDAVGAQQGYDAQFGMKLITSDEYKARTEELTVDIHLAQAERGILAGGITVNLEAKSRLDDLPTERMSTAQLAQRRKLTKQANNQIIDDTHTEVSSVIGGMTENNNATPQEKAALAKQYEQQIEVMEAQYEANGEPIPGPVQSEIKKLRKDIQKWELGTGDESHPIILRAVMADIGIEAKQGANPEDIRGVLANLDKEYAAGNINQTDYVRAKQIIADPLPSDYIGVQNTVLSKGYGRAVAPEFQFEFWKQSKDNIKAGERFDLKRVLDDGLKLAAALNGARLKAKRAEEAPASLPQPQTQPEYDRLAPGPYIDPNGVRRIKP